MEGRRREISGIIVKHYDCRAESRLPLSRISIIQNTDDRAISAERHTAYYLVIVCAVEYEGIKLLEVYASIGEIFIKIVFLSISIDITTVIVRAYDGTVVGDIEELKV